MLSTRYPTHTGSAGINASVIFLLNGATAVPDNTTTGNLKPTMSVTGKPVAPRRVQVDVSRLTTLAGVQGCHSAAPPSPELLSR